MFARFRRLGIGAYVFFFNDTATTEIYTLSLHDALPIYSGGVERAIRGFSEEDRVPFYFAAAGIQNGTRDRKSTRLNSSHQIISYAVFCLKKKSRYGGTAVCLPGRLSTPLFLKPFFTCRF